MISVDHPLARLWLRSGTRSLAERCDLLVMWENNSTSVFELIAVEVKSSDEKLLSNASTRLAHAVDQISNTLNAIADGLGAAGAGQTSPLSIPRCEMLKQTLARAAQARSGDPTVDRVNRIRWGSWLMRLFGQDETTSPAVRLSGCIVSVLLRRAAVGLEEQIASDGDNLIVHRVLGEREVGELLEWEPGELPDSDAGPAPSEGDSQIPLTDMEAESTSTPFSKKLVQPATASSTNTGIHRPEMEQATPRSIGQPTISPVVSDKLQNKRHLQKQGIRPSLG